jgi:hypothetical protein
MLVNIPPQIDDMVLWDREQRLIAALDDDEE